MRYLSLIACLAVPCGLAGAAADKAAAGRPTGLMCELMAAPGLTAIVDPAPEFTWIVPLTQAGDRQTAYQLLVASSRDRLTPGAADLWDSGAVSSDRSVAVEYGGAALVSNARYLWRVRTWNRAGQPSAWSESQEFATGALGGTASRLTTSRYPLEKTEVAPTRLVRTAPGRFFVDFGRAAFGTIRFTATCAQGGSATVHLGEKATADDAVDRAPGGTIRYRAIVVPLEEGTHTYLVAIPPDRRNTGGAAIRMPKEVGEVLPFRYAELEGVPEAIKDVTQVAVHYRFDDDVSAFNSTDDTLNAVWDLCKYSIKATSFTGVYIDGDRERIPYEADAYINQLSHYGVDREYTLARYSHEYLILHPTWPTEWPLHSVLMAWADYLYTGDLDSARAFYSDLTAKTLHALARPDGLISTRTGLVTKEFLATIHASRLRDIVDWPAGERDGYEFRPINTVVNALHYRALVLMGRLAAALEKDADAAFFRERAARVERSFNEKLFNAETGLYVDGEGATHSSQHANIFAVAMGLAPEERLPKVIALVKARGMRCSVYVAQYLLEALYEAGEAEHALALMRSREERSWYNMILAGSTITLEAWAKRFKPNLDWNHAWGAVPANIIPRYLLGVRPLEPGFARAHVQPQLGSLSRAIGTVPTIRGPVTVAATQGPPFALAVALPAGMTARVVLPAPDPSAAALWNGKRAAPRFEAGTAVFESVPSGRHEFTVTAGESRRTKS